jgi:hypothetical protein
MVRSFIEFIHQRLAGIQDLAVHPHTHPFFVRLDDHALVAHPAHQVERLHGFAAQRQFFHVGRHAPLDRRPQLLLDREEAVRRTHPLQPLVRAAVIVMLHPVGDPVPGFLEGLEARPRQELVFQRLPEALDFPKRHRMMRRTADVVDVIALEFLLELRGASPTGVLPPVVGEHLPRRAVRRHCLAVDLHHVGAGLAAVHPQSGNVPGVVIEEPDDVRRCPQDGEVGDVTLPHLVRRGALEPAGRRLRLLAGLRLGRRQPRRLQVLAHRLGTGFEEEQPPQDLRNPLRTLLRVGLFEFRDLRVDRNRKFCAPAVRNDALQPPFPALPVVLRPLVNRALRDSHFTGNDRGGDAFFQVKPHRVAPHFVRIRGGPIRLAFRALVRRRRGFRRRRAAPPSPPRGALPLLPLNPGVPPLLLLLTHR